MNKQQKPVMDSYIRVRSSLDAYPTTRSLSYASAREMLVRVPPLTLVPRSPAPPESSFQWSA